MQEVLDDAMRLRMSVIRCWAFCDGADEWNALQPTPGERCLPTVSVHGWAANVAMRTPSTKAHPV